MMASSVNEVIVLLSWLVRNEAKKGSGVFGRNGPEGASHQRLPTPFSDRGSVALERACGNSVRGDGDPGAPGLDAWPVPTGCGWLEIVNRAETEAELAELRRSLTRGAPFGDTAWQERTAKRLGLESTLRPRGRLSKTEER